jgi:hypothetical protein
VVVAYFIANPLMILLITKYVLFVQEMKFLWIFAIYGYSFSIFLISTILIAIPVMWLRWVFLGISGVISLIFIIMEIFLLMKEYLNEKLGKFFFIVFYLIGSHGVFVLALKYYFLK